MGENWRKRTALVHDGIRRSQYGEVAEAIWLTQSFVYDSAEQAEARFIASGEDEFIYARYGNPTVRMFEDRIAALEGAEDGFATASGMAAVNAALMSMLKAGDHVVSARALFGSCLYIVEEILPRFGVEVTFVDGTDNAAWARAIRPDTAVVFLETMSNPTLELIDLGVVADLAHAVGAAVVVDNVFATPIYSRALELGADVVVYSTTKHVDGQGRCLGGVVLGTRDYIRKTLEPFLKHTGGAMSPFTAWVMLKGLETLDLRVRAMTASAGRISAALEDHSKLQNVIYPHLPSHPQHDLAKAMMEEGGTMLSIDVAGGQAAAFRVLNALQIFTISNNLGDAKSIVTHPATTTHQRLSDEQRARLGISPGLIRVSIGIEDGSDLLDDLLQALDRA
ncbi:MAG: O-succinylhomoserine sulfhydrylase [Rhodobacteraceae bacterium]|nr:O-succinylhomoserine sulfhydrylase [Paracoccaceae bacterium]